MAQNTSWLTAKQTRFATYAVLYTLIILAIVGGINFLANRYNKSFDSTSNKKFTLSDQTEKIAKNLKEPLTITYWDRSTNFDTARDLLDRYKNLSSKIDVQYQDVDKKKTQAMAAGVKTYGTIFVNVGNKQQEAKSLTEEEVTGAMVRALKGGERMACFTLDSGEHSLADTESRGYSRLKELVERNNYKTDTVHLLQKPEIPQTCTILVVGGPTHDYQQTGIDAIKNYLENGGRLLVMMDPPLKFAKTETDDNDAFLKVVSGWGVTFEKDLVLDTSGLGQIFNLGPEYALVTSYQSHAIVREMKDVPTGFPIARSLEIKNGDHTTVEKLFETGENSFATFDLKSPEIKPGKNDKKGPLTLGAAGTYTTNKENGNGRFVAVGSSNWVSNGFLPFNGNRDLFLNMMNWLSSDEDLISIRPKETQDRPLNMTNNQMTIVQYESVFAIPLAIIIAGVLVWWKRR